jgi:hypothetical protein
MSVTGPILFSKAMQRVDPSVVVPPYDADSDRRASALLAFSHTRYNIIHRFGLEDLFLDLLAAVLLAGIVGGALWGILTALGRIAAIFEKRDETPSDI